MSDVYNLSQPASYIAMMKSKAACPNESIRGILLPSRLVMFLCLMNSAIWMREHNMLQASLCKNSLVPKREIGPKWPFQRFRSAGMLASYGIADGGTGNVKGAG